MEKQIDYFEDLTFHPSLDIKHGILVLGFRIKPELNKEENVFLVVSKDCIQKTKDVSFIINDQTYYIDLKHRRLGKLSKQWSGAGLESVIENINKNFRDIVKPSEVFNEIKILIKEHVDLEEADYTLLSTWIIGTYLFPIFSAYPYLHIKAPKGSGKTQCLSCLNQICFNSTKARASLPALRDTVDSLRGTYLMDQADALHRPHMEDLLDILTDSYKKGGGDVRKMVSDAKKSWHLEEFQAYGPKGFASIHPLPEDLRDRCLIISLTRSKKNLKSLDEENPVWKDVRDKIYKLLITRFEDFSLQYEFKRIAYKQVPTLVGRQLELWLPLEIVMSTIGVSESEQELAKKKFISQYGFAESQVSDLERAVIDQLQELLVGETELVISPKEIAEKMDSMLFEDVSSIKQQAVQVGKIISKFNLSSEKLPRSNKGERYRFSKEKVEKIYQGYFAIQTEDNPTPTYTPENVPEMSGDLT